MPKTDSVDITVALNQSLSSNPDLSVSLMEKIYVDLRRIAANRLQYESPANTVSVTILVHEAFLTLSNNSKTVWKDRVHFYGAAAETMRRVMVDRARYNMSKRRQPEKDAFLLDENLVVESTPPRELLELDDALCGLESVDAYLAQIVKLKHFVGLSIGEIAELYGVSPRTVNRKWGTAKAWLLAEMEFH